VKEFEPYDIPELTPNENSIHTVDFTEKQVNEVISIREKQCFGTSSFLSFIKQKKLGIFKSGLDG
jgi:hypothetical protein